MTTWADIQNGAKLCGEAQQTIGRATHRARLLTSSEIYANDIRSEGRGPDQMRQQLRDQDRLDSSELLIRWRPRAAVW